MMNAHSLRRTQASLTMVVAAIVAGLLVGGCALSRPAPVKQTFLVEAAPPAAAATTHPATLRVGAMNVAAPFRGKAFVYRMADLRFEADYYNEFLVAPGAMLGEGTARSLDRALPAVKWPGGTGPRIDAEHAAVVAATDETRPTLWLAFLEKLTTDQRRALLAAVVDTRERP